MIITETNEGGTGIIIVMVVAMAAIAAGAIIYHDATDTGTPSDHPSTYISGSADFEGNIYVSFVYSKTIMMIDGDGKVLYHKHEDTDGVPAGYWDFKKHVIGGKTYYSYHDQDLTEDKFGLPGFAPGERVLLDENFIELKRIRFKDSPNGIVEEGHPLDGHDFLLIDPDHYIMSGYLKGTVDNIPDDVCDKPESEVIYSYLQEVDHGNVVWEWRSIDYPQLYALTQTDAEPAAANFANEGGAAPDYVHFNAMRLDADGHLICSFRHLDSVLCLDRGNDTSSGQILWRLSGTTEASGPCPRISMDDSLITSGQHYVTVEDANTIRVFNNGNAQESTCIRIFTIDWDHMTATAQDLKVPGRFSSACGSVEHVKDNIYVIGWGRAENDTKCMSVYDFDTGTELMYMELDDKNNFTYRCAYYP